MIKLLYKPFALLLGALAGALASKVFEQLWTRIAPGEPDPSPTRKETGWDKVLASSAMRGAIYAVVTAAVSRGGATVVERATGTWPGEIEREAA
jgi:hypothetical protein